MNIPNNGAIFAARVYNEACRREANEEPFDNWKLLHQDERTRLAMGFMYLHSYGIMSPISLRGVGNLRRLKWDWILPYWNKNEANPV